MRRPKRWLLAAALAIVPAVAVGGAGMAAQDEDAEAVLEERVVTARPVTINPGFCAEEIVPEPLIEIGELGPLVNEEGEVPEPEEVRGFQTSPPVLDLEEAIPVTYDELLEAPHAVVVHESPDDFGTYVACGELGGVVVDGKLAIGLRPLNDSDFYGVAVFELDLDVFDNELLATIYLFEDVGREGPAGVPQGEQVEVAIGPEGFAPAEVTLPAGGGVIELANEAEEERRFVIEELGVDETLMPGETREILVEAEPGEYRLLSPVEEGEPVEGILVVEEE